MHPGQDPTFYSDMYFLHVIPNERRITHVLVSLNAAPTKVWACASSRDCQLEDNSEFLVSHTISFCCQDCQLSLPLIKREVLLARVGSDPLAGLHSVSSLWTGADFLMSSSSWVHFENSVVFMCWGLGFLSYSSSKILELIFPSTMPPSSPFQPLNRSPLPPCPPTSAISPVNQVKSTRTVEKKNKTLCIPGRRQSSNAPYCKNSPSLGWKEGQPKICVSVLGFRKGQGKLCLWS